MADYISENVIMFGEDESGNDIAVKVDDSGEMLVQ